MAANFSDRVPLCFLADARLRSHMLVCLLSCLFFLQSEHSTDFRRGTVGDSNDKLRSSIFAVFEHVFEELWVHWSRAMTFNIFDVSWCVVVMLVPTCHNMESARSQFQLFKPQLRVYVRIDVRKLFS